MEFLSAFTRSFVRRERRINHNLIPQTLWKKYRITPNTSKLIVFCEHFEQTAPLTLEIGFGTGDSLFIQAQSNINQAYLGIEVYKTGIKNLLHRLQKTPLDNLKLLEGDAVDLLSNHIASDTLDNIQILFPDPWPKRRHHKRRLIQTQFISLLHKVLKPQGVLYLATDWEHYAQHMLHTLENSAFTNSAGEYQFAARPEMIPVTKFEKRAQMSNQRIFYFVFSK